MLNYSYNLEDRTLQFSKELICLCHKLNSNEVNKILIRQLLRSGTSIGANYREANESKTKKDFKNRLKIAKQECKETVYWLELVLFNNKVLEQSVINLLDESKQLMRIIASIYSKV